MAEDSGNRDFGSAKAEKGIPSFLSRMDSLLMEEMEDFVISNRVKEPIDLVYYARKKREDWHELLVRSRNAMRIAEMFCAWVRKDGKYILPWPFGISYDEDDNGLKEDDVLKKWKVIHDARHSEEKDS